MEYILVSNLANLNNSVESWSFYLTLTPVFDFLVSQVEAIV